MHSVEGTFTTCININAPDQSSSCHIFLECWWRKLAKNQRSLPAFFLGPKAHVHDPVHVLLVGLNHMHGPMQNFLVCFGAPKLYAFPICKCYAFLNILLGYPLCLTTTHKCKTRYLERFDDGSSPTYSVQKRESIERCAYILHGSWLGTLLRWRGYPP